MTGGIDLAAEWAGFTTVGQCEYADYPTKVLEKHWPNVPRWRDIRDVTRESVQNRGIGAIDLISGGDPCQPHSTAGKRKGKADERYLWPEMFRVIKGIQPNWVVNENVIGSISNGVLDEKIFDLESEKYEVQAFDIPALATGAPHQRRRIIIVANSKNKNEGLPIGKRKEISQFGSLYENVCDSTIKRLPNWTIGKMEEPKAITESKRSDGRKTKSRICRVGNGIPHRVDRLKCLGNAVVPQQIYPILKAIADIENNITL